MALIKCPECGGDVSDQAPACIHCGFPLGEYVAQLKEDIPRYDLYAMNTRDDQPDEEKKLEARLFEELMGMDYWEFIHVRDEGIQMVAEGVTLEQAYTVVGAFVANGIRYNIAVFEHDEHDGERHSVTSDIVNECPSEYKEKQDHYEEVVNEAQKIKIAPPEPTSRAAASSAAPASSEGTGPKCPTCGSTNVQKINQAGRLVSTAVWGVASKKMAKTYKCNKCGYTW